MGQPRPLFWLFSVFSNKQDNFYNKSMCKNITSIQDFKPTTAMKNVIKMILYTATSEEQTVNGAHFGAVLVIKACSLNSLSFSSRLATVIW